LERGEILKQINKLFIDTLDNEAIVMDENTHAADIEEWDSLTHILLVVAIEKHFKVKFNSKEIMSWKNVGELINSIMEKRK